MIIPGFFWVTVVGAVVYYLMDKCPSKTDDYATSEFKGSEALKGLTGNDGLVISKRVQLNEKSCYEGVVIIGPTGSGKTTSSFLPNLLSDSIPKNSSIIVSDPKGELYRLTANYQRSIGRDTLLFSPLKPKFSLKYNPLEQCKDLTEVRELGQNLLMNGVLALEIATGKKTGGTEWVQMATPLFVASLLYCWKKGRPLNTIAQAFNLIINTSDEDLDHLLSNAGEEVKAQYNIFKSCGGADRTIGSIKITLTSNLQLFTDPYLIETTKYSEFKPETLREKPTCLYIMYPENKASYLSPFTSCFYSQLINRSIEVYNNKSLPIFFLFDEFANVGQLSNYHQNVATVRSRKMSMIICLQNVTQLYQLYGKENALSILNNLKTKVILPGLADISTVNWVSDLCGYTKVTLESKTQGDKGASFSYSTSRKKLLEPDEVRRIDNDKLLIIAHNRQPVLDEQNIYYNQDRYLKNVKESSYPIW